MSAPEFPKGIVPSTLKNLLKPLSLWASKSSAEADLETIFGLRVDWASALKHLVAFRRADFSLLPVIRTLPATDMPGLWGGYSRDTREIYLSADCPQESLSAVLIEEIGHFLDQEICAEETPGEEGSRFAAAVLGLPLDSASSDDSLAPLFLQGRELLVEAARKARGSFKSKSGGISRGKKRGSSKDGGSKQNGGSGYAEIGSRSSNPKLQQNIIYATEDGTRIPQKAPGDRLIGSRGNDTFAVISQDVKIEDPNGGTDTVESSVTFSLEGHSIMENLLLTGGGNTNATGNRKANVITGNSGNNKLDGGTDSAIDTLVGGAGNDTYALRDTFDKVVEAAGGGTDTIETVLNVASLVDFAADNVENLTFTGTGSSTITGNGLANVLTGGSDSDSIFGGVADTLVGGDGDDVFYVQSSTAFVVEGSGASGGDDTVSTALSTYSIAAFDNVEALVYTGGASSKLTGNSGNNAIHGGFLVRNTIDGGLGNDYIIGGSASDSLIGGSGSDTLLVNQWSTAPIGALGVALQAGGGSDTLVGGEGRDWYVVNSQTAYTFVETGTDRDTIASTVKFSLAYNSNISANIENLFLVGNGNISGTGSSLANVITGNDGNNELSAGVGNDTVYGGLGADIISGETGDDTLVGGGQPQADLPDDASTAIEVSNGQVFTGTFDFRRDEDWIRVRFTQGETYQFKLTATLSGNAIFQDYSWISLFEPVTALGNSAYGASGYLTPRYDNTLLESPSWSQSYDGYDGGKFEVIYDFTPFDSGEFYIPVRVGGPSTGTYQLSLSSLSTPLIPAFGTVIADDASNTLIGGLGNDYLVAGGGRDSVGNIFGDKLLGGTNGIPGSIDQDTLTGRDTLIGAGGADVLDGGKGADSMIGGGGSDTYYVDSSSDKILETDNGGSDDLGVFDLTQGRSFSNDLSAGLFALTGGLLSSVTGAGFDVDLANVYSNVEHASLMGSANLYVLGNSDGNSLIGNFGNNLLVGALGDDSLLGQGGNDYLIGGEGGDLLDGGSGVNTMDGGLGSDTYVINDRADRIIYFIDDNDTPSDPSDDTLHGENDGLDGGIDLVRTYFNFDPIQGDGVNQFDPAVADNSPSVNKAKSFASEDLESFYNLENFELLGGAVYGVGNALANSITAGPASSVLYGMGGEDAVLGGDGDDTLYGDTPDFYASPDLYAAAPKDTQTQAFLDGVIGSGGSDYLDGGAGDNYLDGGRGFDTMIGGAGNDTFVQDNVDDYVVAGGGANELISSVNIAQAPDGISKLMLVVAKQAADSGQDEVASFGSFLGTKFGNNRSISITTGGIDVSLDNANVLELMYAPRAGDSFIPGGVEDTEDAAGNPNTYDLQVSLQEDDLSNPGKFQYDLSWNAAPYAATDVVGYVVKYKRTDIVGDIWHTYVNGKSQDFQGTRANPILTVNNLEDGTYDFQVNAVARTIPALNDRTAAQHVTLQGGAGNDAVLGLRLIRELPGGLVDDAYTDPLVQNNPNFPTPLGFIFNPAPYNPTVGMPDRFATYLDGGFGNDILNGDFVNDRSGDDYVFQGVTFKGLNTLVGGQGSDTFVVKNGGNAIGDEFDWVIKYGNETPVVTQVGNVGSSLNGGQHNLVVSRVDFLTLSDELVNQGKFIDQLALAELGQFGQGNRLDNYIYDAGTGNTLVGDKGRDSIVGAGANFLIGGTAYGLDQVGLAVRDFASEIYGGNGLTNSVFRDTDPIPVSPNGPGTADPSQFWFVPGYYGSVYDPIRNQDTLVAGGSSYLDGGAGKDSLVGSGGNDMFFVSQGQGGASSQNIQIQDAVFGNKGNDTVTFTDSDYLWWSGNIENSLLLKNGYTIANDISNLILQAGSPSARDATGNHSSEGNYGQGSNIIEGNEFDNSLNGGGVGGSTGTGTGVDVLIGGSGKDNFVVSGYTNSTSNEWAPSIIDYTEGPLAGKSVWIRIDSVYTDADYVVVDDFEAGDNLQLAGNASNYWIGAAPSGNGIPSSFVDNIPLLSYLQTPSTTRFGIYTSGTPNLVAIVNLVGGLSLDTLSLELAFDPAPSNTVDTSSPFRNVLGWGTFWNLAGSSFAKYVNQSYVQEDSYASLTTLVRSGDDTFIGGVLADFYNGYGGNDSLLGGDNNDTFLGGSGNDSLFGQAGNDSLLGEAGADYLSGGPGGVTDADQLIGGQGDDTYVVDEFDTVREELNEGTDLAISSVTYTLAGNFENLLLTGTDSITGTGNSLGNRLTGNSLNNILAGLAGNDTLDGGAGTDTLDGGDGNDLYLVDGSGDTIVDASGADTVRTSASFNLSDTKVASGSGIEHLVFTGTTTGVSLSGNINANSITGAAGSDTIDGKEGNDTLIGGAGDDFYVYTSSLASGNDRIVDADGIDTILTATHFDLAATALNASVQGLANIENLQLTSTSGASLFGNALNNSILGNTGNDTLDGRGNPDTLSGDTLIGGSGNDYYIVNSTRDEILESTGGGLDTVETSVDFDLSNTLIGGLKNIENIKGNNGGITLTGNINANSLIGGVDSQYMVGGIGDDTYTVGAGDVASESEDQGTDLVVADTSYTLGANIENLNLVGSAISGTGNSLANIITGNGLANSLDGGAGADTLIGNGGGDTFVVDNLGDSLVGGAGTDFVVSSITYTLGSNIEHLTLIGSDSIGGTGNSGDNTITGNASNNTLDGGTGKNTLVGLGGDDTYVINSLDDIVVETSGGGTDLVTAKVTGYILTANVENLTLDTGIVAGTGNILANTITGNASSNSLNGDAGNDTLVGSLNRGIGEIDTLTGGSGIDLFILGDKVNPFYAAAPSAGDYALITDFAVADGDQLQLKDLSSGAHASTVKGYLIGGQIGGYDYTGASGANCYLYRDNTSDGIVNDGDNLIAAINSTGGTGGGGILRTSDLNTVGFFVI